MFQQTKTQNANKSYIDTIKQIYKNGGLLSFYKGNGINTIKVFPESALKFFVFEYSKEAFAYSSHSKDRESIGVSGRFIAGGISGLISQFVIYPLETIKTRMMSQISHSQENTSNPIQITSLIRHMYREGGIKSFYHGLLTSLVGIFPYAGIDLGVFETLRIAYLSYQRKLCEQTGEIPPDRPPMTAVLIMGMASGGSGACIMYPLSVIRTR